MGKPLDRGGEANVGGSTGLVIYNRQKRAATAVLAMRSHG
jgi:hypothetical protein